MLPVQIALLPPLIQLFFCKLIYSQKTTTYPKNQCDYNKLSLLSFFRPGGIPARNHRGERLLLYLGVIDILQSYRMAKKLEHVFKAIIHDGVSAFSVSQPLAGP